jgi:predicted RNA-binding Zn ribbon-like protein
MQPTERNASNLELLGGCLCLDYANTVSTRIESLRHEYLTSYGELVAWSRHASILTDAEAKALLTRAAGQAALAAVALERAIALREAIFQIFAAVADNRKPDKQSLTIMNAFLREASCQAELAPTAEGFEWTWTLEPDGLDGMLWPIAHSAAELLTSPNLTRVRRCAREGCDWLFLDLSKNRSRRWCSMEVCGSRVKSRRYYHRKKGEGQAG